MGQRKMLSPLMNVRRDPAELMIFQGTMIQPAVTVTTITPLRMLIYFGKRLVRSLDALMTFADKLVPICPTTQLNPTKKAPQRPAGPCHSAASVMGSHKYVP